MGHQAAVQFDQQVVGQPVGKIHRLVDLQGGAARRCFHLFDSCDSGPPVGALIPEHAQAVQHAALAHGAAAKQPGPHGPAVASVTAKHLVAALAAEHHLEAVFMDRTGQFIGGQDGIVRRRVVGGGNDGRQ